MKEQKEQKEQHPILNQVLTPAFLKQFKRFWRVEFFHGRTLLSSDGPNAGG